MTPEEIKTSSPLLKPDLEESFDEPYGDLEARPSESRTEGVLGGNEISSQESTNKTSQLMAMSSQTDDLHDQAQAKVSHAKSSKPYNTTVSVL